MDNETILLIAMKDLYWSQEELARRLGTTRRTISRYLSKGTPDKIAYAVQWLYYLEMGEKLNVNNIRYTH